jgi:uncharacterized protein
MKIAVRSIVLIELKKLNTQHNSEKLSFLSFGSVEPAGWFKEQIQKHIHGFLGNPDQVPELINAPIYSTGCLQKHSRAKVVTSYGDTLQTNTYE